MRYLGVASASAALLLGVAGNAMACSIRDFSATAECDADGKGVISVTDVDPTGVPAEVTVHLENKGADERLVGTKRIENSTAEGVTVTFPEDWKPNAEYRIHITAGSYVNEDLEPLITPAEACTASDNPPPADEAPKPSEEPADEPSDESSAAPSGDSSAPAESPVPSASESTAPAAPGDSGNVPGPAGQSNLAETGAGSSTPVIAGIAAVLVLIGGGAVYFAMRRRGASRG
ncbi:LAETG motif-containing sortase-dependent surface protein [Streptomyces poonensis]|uniref:Alpha-ketoglutarate decarboxylase n=1 Tax=Streptomyces poonensis TaxID=68255 RepID=A0A918P7D3_9ACTN|nr:LAETG motif-containing sortase-dependent surface protein [Streptomyces poonensis]GGY86445.1 alpha-ketoglutarate decarboxylase [Streptomyces poonensis]GLJ92245.1 alpha-ketoglutarate decarboxylase [Streptomyces poonensis]